MIIIHYNECMHNYLFIYFLGKLPHIHVANEVLGIAKG